MAYMSDAISSIRLRELVRYEKNTGRFIAVRARRSIKGIGKEVGWIDDRGYRRMSLDGYEYFAHRLAWFWVYGVWPTQWIDHKNLKRDDNRIANLREVTPPQNGAHKNQWSRSSKFKGIARHKKRWAAQIGHNYKHFYLGSFPTPEEAARAYDRAARKLFGRYAKTNQSLGLL